MHTNSARAPQNRLDFIGNQSMDAERRSRPSEPRVATAPAGLNGGARGGDGAPNRRNHGGSYHVQITQDQYGEGCGAAGAQDRPEIEGCQTAAVGHQGRFIAKDEGAFGHKSGTPVEESGDA